MKSASCNTPVAAAAQWCPPQVGWPQHTASQLVPGVVWVQRSRVVNPGRLVLAGLAREWREGRQGALCCHRQVPTGTRGPRWSEGSRPLPRHLHPGHQGTVCCLGIPQTQRTQGWLRPGSQSE